MSPPYLRHTTAGVEISLYIQPRSSQNKIIGVQGDELKIKVTAPPVDGAANKACCDYLAKVCKIPKSHVKVTSGETSRHKRVLLEFADSQEVSVLLKDLLGG